MGIKEEIQASRGDQNEADRKSLLEFPGARGLGLAEAAGSARRGDQFEDENVVVDGLDVERNLLEDFDGDQSGQEETDLQMSKQDDGFKVLEPCRSKNGLDFVKNHCLGPCSSCDRFAGSVASFLPIIKWLPRYNVKENFVPDLMGGITTGVLHVPQGIAYALLSGVKPVNGLYMSFFASFFYMFFGTSRHTSLGSFAVVALMTGVTNENVMLSFYGSNATSVESSPDYLGNAINPVTIASTLTFTVGLIQLLTAVLKLEFLTSYFSDPLVAGFTTGAAVHVLTSQVDDILGIKMDRISGPGYLFVVLYKMAMRIPEANWWTLGCSFFGGLFLVVGKDYVTPGLKKVTGMRIIIPYELIVMIIFTTISTYWQLNDKENVYIVGSVPAGLPEPSLPQFSLIPSCFSSALAISIVVIAVHISMAKMIAKRKDYSIDPGQEMYALGFASTLSGFFPVFPNSTALGRTMVQVESGVKTQMAAVFTCLFLLAVILFLGPYFENLPLCILSTVIVVALRPMFRKFKTLPELYRTCKIDFTIWVTSFLATVCIDVIGGLAVSVAVTLLTLVFRTQWPNWKSKISSPEYRQSGERMSKNICIFEFESFLLFTNAERFKSAAQLTINEWVDNRFDLVSNIKSKDSFFVFDCSAITQIDTMGLNAMKDVVIDLQKKTTTTVYYCNARDSIKKALINARIAERDEDFYDSVDQFLRSVKATEKQEHVNTVYKL